MLVDYLFDGGTPCDIEAPDDITVRCTPYATNSGSQWFYFCVRVLNPRPGGARMIIQWPRRLTRADLPADATEEQIRRSTGHQSFVQVLDRCLCWSTDMHNWHPLPSALDPETEQVSFALPDAGTTICIATQFPYLQTDYDALIAHVGQEEPGSLRVIGRSRAGRDIYALSMDCTGPAGRHGMAGIFIQAYQHATEFTGPLVADAMIHHLLSDAGRHLREKFSFDIVPVFDVDRLYSGLMDPIGRKLMGIERSATRNPNRDWDGKSWPEVRAVDAFIREQMAGGRRYRLGLDLHNGWSHADSTGACYTVFGEGEAPPDYLQRQRDLIAHLYAHTDHEKERTWHHASTGRFVDYFYATTGAQVHTVEFSRHLWYDRASGQYIRPAPNHPRRFAVDMLNALATAPGFPA